MIETELADSARALAGLPAPGTFYARPFFSMGNCGVFFPRRRVRWPARSVSIRIGAPNGRIAAFQMRNTFRIYLPVGELRCEKPHPKRRTLSHVGNLLAANAHLAALLAAL